MQETTIQPAVEPLPEQRQDDVTQKLFGSGFEDEQPEPDFDERM